MEGDGRKEELKSLFFFIERKLFLNATYCIYCTQLFYVLDSSYSRRTTFIWKNQDFAENNYSRAQQK